MIKWSELGCETYSGCGRIEFGNNRLAGHRNAKLYSDFSCDLTVYQSGGKNLKNACEDQGGMNICSAKRISVCHCHSPF